MNQDTEPSAAALRLAWVWLWVGISQMSPLQVIQFVAAIVATLYSSVLLWVLVRDKIVRRKIERDTMGGDL